MSFASLQTVNVRSLLDPKFVIALVSTITAAWLVQVVYEGWRARSVFVELRKMDQACRKFTCSNTANNQKPMPKHNLFLGHLLAIKPYIDNLPPDAHGFIPFGKMARECPGGIFYLDMWPFIGPIMICTSATAAIQATQRTVLSLKKPISLQP